MSRRQAAPFSTRADRERRLIALAGDPDAARLLSRLAECGHSALLREIASVELAEAEAEAVLKEILHRRGEVARALGRDPGLVWAALDYFCSNAGLVRNPAVEEVSGSVAEASGNDPRTGLLDPIAVDAEVDREHRRTLRHGDGAALLLARLDGRETVQATAVDRVLRALGRGLRETDIAGRSDEDELIAILPRTDRLAASSVGERLRRRRMRESSSPTLSIGIACIPQDASSVAEWFATARRALGRAAAEGGDRVVAHANERRSSVRLPVHSALAATVVAENGAAGTTRVVEIGRDGIAIEGISPDLIDRCVRVSIEACRWVVSGRVVRRDPSNGRMAIALAERLPASLLGDLLEEPRTGIES
jgi:diguanylate cyclase (GGDEF)-like protein